MAAEFGPVDTSVILTYGAEIIPDSMYNVQVLGGACLQGVPGDYSSGLVVRTQRWGDVIEPFHSSSGGQPSFIDIAAIVNTFKAIPGAPSRPQSLLQGDVPFVESPVSFREISVCVGAFKGVAFSYVGPGPCN